MFNQILLPLDGSDFAEAALPLALRLSERTGATLHLVSVIEPGSVFTGQEWEVEAKKRRKDYVDEVSARISEQAGGKITTALLTGRVVAALLDEAKRCAADVVVMATHGRGVLSRMWLGSVAEGFLRDTERPMILVRPEADEAPRAAEWNVERLLIPLDGSQLSEHALEHATKLGELFGAAYHLTSVVTYAFDIASPTPHPAQVQAIKDSAEYLEQVAGSMRSRGLSVTTAVAVATQVGQGILAEAEAAGCDAIAMATHARAGITRAMLGSAADKVLRGTNLPVLLVRPPGVTKAVDSRAI